jgi:hypothetical protein
MEKTIIDHAEAIFNPKPKLDIPKFATRIENEPIQPKERTLLEIIEDFERKGVFKCK